MATDDASAAYYKDLSRRGGELAVRYQAAVKDKKRSAEVEEIGNELVGIIGKLSLKLLDKWVTESRTTLSGVYPSKDEGDIFQELCSKVLATLQEGKYEDQGEFKAWILTIAFNLFFDALNYAKGKNPTQQEKDKLQAETMEKDDDVEGAAPNPFPERGASKAKHIIHPLEALRENTDGAEELDGIEPEGQAGFRPDGKPGSNDDTEMSLINRDILNIILEGLRSVKLRPAVEVWAARAFLGHNEKDILDLYGFSGNTATSHFRRASIDILSFINQHEDYKDMSIKGLREIVLDRAMMEEKDLLLIADESQRQALRHAGVPGMTVARLGHLMGLSRAAARKLLRAAVVALSQAKVRRAAVAPLVHGPELDAWLWAQVDKMLEVFPDPPVKVRGEPSAIDGELSALCHVAMMLVYSKDGVEPVKGFGDLVGPRVQNDGLDATAAGLGLERPALLSILSGSAAPGQLGTDMIAKLASYFGLEARTVVTALRAAASASPGGKTRGFSPKEQERYIEGVRRRVMNRIVKP